MLNLLVNQVRSFSIFRESYDYPLGPLPPLARSRISIMIAIAICVVITLVITTGPSRASREGERIWGTEVCSTLCR